MRSRWAIFCTLLMFLAVGLDPLLDGMSVFDGLVDILEANHIVAWIKTDQLPHGRALQVAALRQRGHFQQGSPDLRVLRFKLGRVLAK